VLTVLSIVLGAVAVVADMTSAATTAAEELHQSLAGKTSWR
jgi:hypothetical protein